jgi:hypothetical protein
MVGVALQKSENVKNAPYLTGSQRKIRLLLGAGYAEFEMLLHGVAFCMGLTISGKGLFFIDWNLHKERFQCQELSLFGSKRIRVTRAFEHPGSSIYGPHLHLFKADVHPRPISPFDVFPSPRLLRLFTLRLLCPACGPEQCRREQGRSIEGQRVERF